jgi:probable HAF family extracellular repeat protein
LRSGIAPLAAGARQIAQALAANNAGAARAYDINNYGDVVGEAANTRRGDEYRAFLHVDEVRLMLNLGTLGSKNDPNDSVAFGVNDAGFAVGVSGTSNGASPYTSFLYHGSFGIVALEPLILDPVPVYLQGDKLHPHRMNAAGQICGPRVDNYNGYEGQAYLLTPAP